MKASSVAPAFFIGAVNYAQRGQVELNINGVCGEHPIRLPGNFP